MRTASVTIGILAMLLGSAAQAGSKRSVLQDVDNKQNSNTLPQDLPKRLSLRCAMLDPRATMGELTLHLERKAETPAGVISLTIPALGLEGYSPSAIALVAPQRSDPPGNLTLQVDAPGGSLTLHFEQRSGSWAVNVVPTDWTMLGGPIATGMCNLTTTTTRQTFAQINPGSSFVKPWPVTPLMSWQWGGQSPKSVKPLECRTTNRRVFP